MAAVRMAGQRRRLIGTGGEAELRQERFQLGEGGLGLCSAWSFWNRELLGIENPEHPRGRIIARGSRKAAVRAEVGMPGQSDQDR